MRVDRRAVVDRHAVELTGVDPQAPLSVGNGELAVTVDVTGFQTLPDLHPVPDPSGRSTGTLLGTLAQWAWHSAPRPVPDDAEALLERERRTYRTRHREVAYVDAPSMAGADDSAMGAGARWLRANPHRLDLGRIGLVGLGPAPDPPDRPGVPEAGPVALAAADVTDARQRLDLWHGTLRSSVVVRGVRLDVTTACHPEIDAVAWRVVAPDGGAGRLGVRVAFPYGSQAWADAADWTRPEAHASVVHDAPGGAVVDRVFDGGPDPLHRVLLRVSTDTPVLVAGPHELVVPLADGGLDLVVAFVPAGRRASSGPAAVAPSDLPDAAAVVEAAAAHWPAFWSRGAALDLAGTPDPRARELERRVVLSQYLTAVHAAGSLPPQETGMVCNSWRGRFHLEMHLWHAAHFPLWGRPDLLERSMGFYARALPAARATAARQGYDGARWPKQVGPDARESPSHIGPFLLWQQPHPVHLAELLRRAAVAAAGGAEEGGRAVVDRYAEVVDATARFMAAVAERDDGPGGDGRYHLGPPVIPAQESYADIRAAACDPPFELASWAWALGVAQEWRERAGLAREPAWDDVREGLARPVVRDGAYQAVAVPPWTVRDDHPSAVYGLGVVPDTGYLDRDVVAATLDGVLADWDWTSTWGWDYPALAMTATRLGRREQAVDLLLRDTPKNAHLANGHNRQTAELPVYLPGNGGLLLAVALMVGGWAGSAPLPGLPGDWVVRHEGFVPAP